MSTQPRSEPPTAARGFPVAWLMLSLCLGPAMAQETERLYLSGHGKDDAVPWQFLCTTGAQSGFWTNLPVPSNWELHGFGTLNYKKDSTNAWDEKGLYRRDFRAPADWSDRRVFLVFEGVMTDTSATINGRPAGPTHQGGFYRFQYEITRWLRFGDTNTLEVTVAKHSANNSVNRAERLADYWVFGGIYRPVLLEARPKRFIERVAIDARADGTFIMDVFADGVTNAGAPLAVEAQITEATGQPAGPPFGAEVAGDETTLKSRVAGSRTWTAETPSLYRVEVQLKQGRTVLHRINQRFGFRTFTVRDGDGLYLNGRRVVLKGANRHSFWPDSGRCLSEAVHRLDLETMKDMNLNAVRMSHYPPDSEFLDLCDQLGLYVLDELGGWHNHYDTGVGRKLVAEMVARDVNHPCVLFWDNGNEGGFNPELDGDFARWDPQRRRVLHPWTPFSGLNTAHYLAYDMAALASAGVPTYYRNGKEIADTNDPQKYIYMPTEFLHGLYDGGAGAGLEDYWNLMRAGKYLGGGFIWALLDDGLKRPDTGLIDTAGNQAPDGIVGPYREREGSFYTIKEIWSPIVVKERELPAGFSGDLTLENRFSFTDANQCRFLWRLRKFRRLDEPGEGYITLAAGTAPAPSVPPGGAGALRLNLPSEWAQAEALELQAMDPGGRPLWTWVWPLAGAESFRRALDAPAVQKTAMREMADSIELSAGSLRVSINRQTGLLTSVVRGSQPFSLANGPHLTARDAKLQTLKHKQDGADYVLTATFAGPLKSVTWRLRGNGWLQCDYAYDLSGTQSFAGVVFDYPEELVKGKRWLGEGPYRVWKNRRRGVTLNVWENAYNNTITGHRGWIYPEFKGCFAGVRWLQLETTEGPITVIPEPADIFVQVLTPEQPPAELVGHTAVELPPAGLGFLHAIPPIGSKFKPAATTGPQGQPNVLVGPCSGRVNFYFGKVPPPS